jgi:hypothetical protein
MFGSAQSLRVAFVGATALTTVTCWGIVGVTPATSAQSNAAPTSRSQTAATTAKAVLDSTFTIAVIPDTQQEVLRNRDVRLLQRSNWLVANKNSLDLRFVTHTGDVVNWDTADHGQYARARAALRPLKAARIPYSLSIGNHDTAAVCRGGSACNTHRTRSLLRNTATFNRYLNDQAADLGGAYQPGRVDNTYHLFTAGGRGWLVLNLELWPRAGAIAWAQHVVATHPHHNVIVVTHSYLTSRGHVYGRSDYGATSPKVLQTKLIKKYRNIRLVVSGHVGYAGHRRDTGVHGNRIDEFLLTMHSTTTNPVRLITINTKSGTLKTWVYAPWTRHTYTGYTVKLNKLHWVR